MEENKNLEAQVAEQPAATPAQPKAKKAGKSKLTFGKVFGAALLAVVVGGLVKLVLWMGIFSTVGAFSNTGTTPIPEEGILKINVNLPVTDAPLKDPFAGFDFTTMSTTSSMTLYNVLQAIDAANSPLVNKVAVVGTYTDEAGKSITVRIFFSHDERTLTREEVQSVVDGVIANLEKQGIMLKK